MSPRPPSAGDPGADFARLFAKHYRAVFGYVYCLVPNWSDADDILQEVGVKLWQGFGKFRPGSDFVRWACTVAHYEVLSFRRRRKLRVPFDPDLLDQLAEPAAEAAGELDDRRDALRECIDRLPPTRRALVELVYGQGKSAADAAKLTDRPAASIHTTLSQIRKQLRDCVNRRLGREGAEEADVGTVAAAADRLSLDGHGAADLAGLLGTAAARRAYAEHMAGTVCLRFLTGVPPAVPAVAPSADWVDQPEPESEAPLKFKPKAKGRPPVRKGPPVLRWAMPFAAAAAVIVGVVLALRPAPKPVAQVPAPTPPPQPAPAPPVVPVATLVAADGDRWEVGPGEAVPKVGARLAAGRAVRLKAGLVKVGFDGGAVALVQGPAGFTPQAGGRVLLTDGVLTATVPAGAEGFTVRTAGGDFVDLGTQFGVQATRAGRAEVHVFVGRVEARAGGASLQANRTEAVALTRPGTAPEPTPFDGGRFPAPGALDPDRPVLREVFLGLATQTNSLDDLVALPKFAAGKPDTRDYLPALEVRPHHGLDKYGSRLVALVRAPQAGEYTFRLAGDDALRLSLGDGPAARGKRVIARVTKHTGFREWTAAPGQISAPVKLDAGQLYHLEVLHRQHSLNDHISVGWTLPDGTKEWPIPGSRLTRTDPLDPVK